MFNNRQFPGTRIGALILSLALPGMLIGPAVAGNRAGTAEDDAGYTRSVQSYKVPDVTLRNRHDEQVELRPLLAADQRPVLLQFIFTSCQTVCPMLTAIMAQAQHDLRQVDPDTRIVSISIDPDHDTPDRMRSYAEKYDAEGDWMFLTGDWNAVRKTLNAFDAMYEGGSKMYHKPYTFMRASPGHRWRRLIGMMGAKTLVGEYRSMFERPTVEAVRNTASTP